VTPEHRARLSRDIRMSVYEGKRAGVYDGKRTGKRATKELETGEPQSTGTPSARWWASSSSIRQART
jgi:hypothetical protein